MSQHFERAFDCKFLNSSKKVSLGLFLACFGQIRGSCSYKIVLIKEKECSFTFSRFASASCTTFIYDLHIRPSFHVRPSCTSFMYDLHIRASFHVRPSCTSFMYDLHVRASCTTFMYDLNVRGVDALVEVHLPLTQRIMRKVLRFFSVKCILIFCESQMSTEDTLRCRIRSKRVLPDEFYPA